MFSCNSDRLFHRGKGKGKILPKTDHEGPEGEQMYSSTLPSTSELDRGWVVSTTPRPLYPWERPGTHCTGGWVGPRAGLDGCGKSRLHRNSIPRPSSRVDIPTELSRPMPNCRPTKKSYRDHQEDDNITIDPGNKLLP